MSFVIVIVRFFRKDTNKLENHEKQGGNIVVIKIFTTFAPHWGSNPDAEEAFRTLSFVMKV